MLSTILNRRSNVARLSWVSVFGLTVSGWLVFGIGLLALLEFKGRLAPPPLSATACIDEKISFLRDRDLSQVRIMGAGSSATWRNLDMSVFGLDPTRALNAAPCYLHIDQTAFLVSLLAEMMPNLQNVITIGAPRDFEDCPPQFTQIFDPSLGAVFIQKQIPVWLPYVVNMRAPYILRTAITLPSERALNAQDAYGSSPLKQAVSWRPAPVFDERCFVAFKNYSLNMAQKHVRLWIATVPTMPEWADSYDPTGIIVKEWTHRLKALSQSGTKLVDGREISFRSEQFADPVHLLSPFHHEFSQFIAERIRFGSKLERRANAF
jgi:hypothetical protein